MGFIIREIHACIAVDADGDEGVIAIQFGNMMMPFVMADKERFDRLLPEAIALCGLEKKELKILKFSVREDVTEQYIPK